MILSKKLFVLQCLALVLFVIGCVVPSMADAPAMAFDRFAVQNNEYSKTGSAKSLVDVLDRAGVLIIVKNLVPEFHDLVVKMEKLFHALDRDRHQHIHDLNRVLGHLKDTWSRSFDEILSERRPYDPVDVNAFHYFLEKYRMMLDRAIHADGLQNSDVGQFLDQLDHLFRALESAYAAIFLAMESFQLPFQLNWILFSKTKDIINQIPDNLFDAEMLGELMKTPKEMMNQFTTGFEEMYKQLMLSPAGQWVPLAINFMQAMSKPQRPEHVEF